MLFVYVIAKMRNVKTILLGLIALSFIGCGSNKNGSVVLNVDDMTGIYRTDSTLLDITSVSSIEIFNGQSELDLTASILRNGLSFNERTYFNTLGEVQWADSRLGRKVVLKNFKIGLQVRNKLKAGVSHIDVCSDKISLDSRTMDFKYCLEFRRESGSLIANGDLVLNVFEFGEKIHKIKTPFRVFIKDRWFVDYFGEWSGELIYNSGNVHGLSLETGQRLDVTFQPVAQTHYILRPLDINQTISLYNEIFVLSPETKEISELEENSNPYINFVYVSVLNGSRKVYFNSFVHSKGYIEGNIELRVNGINPVILGVYSLRQLK